MSEEREELVLRVGLYADPVRQGAEIMADVQPPGGTHAAQDAFASGAWTPVMGRSFSRITGLQTPELIRSVFCGRRHSKTTRAGTRNALRGEILRFAFRPEIVQARLL